MGGLGLLGLLVTIAIMALLANRVLSGTSDANDVVTDAGGGLEVTLPPELTTPSAAPADPANPADPADPAVPTTVAPAPVGGVGGRPAVGDTADAALCQTNRATLETAIQAFELITGAPPVDQQALVDGDILREPIQGYELSSGPNGGQVTGTGACAGR